ncbi:MAG TPA: ATP-grasp domain-containing protein [Actinomycetota bacterium]|nr:ATP-grasp domain-containing protein [Actinomycetota bacterium]
MARVAVLIDPHHDYGVAYIETIFQVWGLQSVCLYTDRRDTFRNAYRYPELQSAAVAGNYLIEGLSTNEIADYLKRDFDVVAVVPHVEPNVLLASELAAECGLSWAQPEVLTRFRDKYALKSHLQAQPNGPRTNRLALVRTVSDVRTVLADSTFDKYVLKPNDGFGNTGVGILDRGSGEAEIRRFLPDQDAKGSLLEEFIEGPEYYVAGQVDGEGNAAVFMIWLSRTVSINGQPNVLAEATKVDRKSPVFAALERYVQDVATATGLRRSPFQADVIVDDDGPCLVEIGARLIGLSGAVDMNLVHGGRVDVFQIAAHYYLTGESLGELNLDWSQYDARAFTNVQGISAATGQIWQLDGVAEVEAMPEFVRWITKPKVGRTLEPTVDLFTTSYRLNLSAEDEQQLQAAVAAVRDTLVFNGGDPPTGAQSRVRSLLNKAQKAARALPRAMLMRPAPLAKVAGTIGR